MNALLVFVVMITLGCQSLSRTSEVTGSPENHEDYIEIQSIPTASENQDFAKFLSKEISEARILGLGEVVHGSGGLHQAMAEVAKSLIKNDGYRSIAIESPWVGVESLDKYFLECATGKTREFPSVQVFPQFTTLELRRLYQWVCDFNKTHPEDRVYAFGFDIQ